MLARWAAPLPWQVTSLQRVQEPIPNRLGDRLLASDPPTYTLTGPTAGRRPGDPNQSSVCCIATCFPHVGQEILAGYLPADPPPTCELGASACPREQQELIPAGGWLGRPALIEDFEVHTTPPSTRVDQGTV